MFLLFRHPGLAQTGEIRGFEQGADLRHPSPRARKGLQAGDARKAISAAQPAGFGKFGGSELEFVFEGISSCEVDPNARVRRIGTACLFKPPDCLVRAGLQQMNTPNTVVPIADPGIARAKMYRLLV